MSNLLTITFYELRRIVRDRRLMLVVLSQPFVIALIVGFLAHRSPVGMETVVRVEGANQFTARIVESLKADERLEIIGEGSIAAGSARAIISIIGQGQGVEGISISADPVLGPYKGILKQSVVEALGDMPVSVELSDATPRQLKYFDYYGSAVMILLVVLVLLNLSGMSVTSERISGTFERLAVTPYSKFDILGGKALGHVLIGVFVSAIGLLSLRGLFGISIGSVPLVVLISALTVLMAVSLGLLISSVTKSVVESAQLAMYAFFVSFLTCGLNAPIETVHPAFLGVMKSTPFYYAVDASRRVNMVGAGWSDIAGNVAIMLAFLVGFLTLAVLLLRKEAR